MASAMRLTQHRLRLVAELLGEGGAVASVAVVSLVAMEVRQDSHKALQATTIGIYYIYLVALNTKLTPHQPSVTAEPAQ